VARTGFTLTRLVILWLLSEGPLHGYRIKRILDDESLNFWFPIQYASIYSVLRTMVKEGHVRVVAVERQGQRPERTRYAITRSGRRHFSELLEKAWRNPPTASDPFQLALAAHSDLQVPVEPLMGERAEALRDRLVTLERLATSAPAPEMVERQMVLTQAELDWVEELITREGGMGR
jgi:DNA-binding PadR family transcriptional regulator